MNGADQLIMDLPLRTAQGREDFLVTESNEEAVAWLDRWPDWPSSALCLFGPQGCGKSHLLAVWADRAEAAVVTPAELLGDTVPDLAAQGTVVLDLGPLDVAAGFDHAEALLHLYNLLAEQGGYLLLASRLPPKQWQIPLADLRSRLLAAPAVRILPPDDRLLVAVMAKMFADRQVRVGQDVLSFMAARIERSFAAAEQAVARLDHNSLSGQRPITIHAARAILASEDG